MRVPFEDIKVNFPPPTRLTSRRKTLEWISSVNAARGSTQLAEHEAKHNKSPPSGKRKREVEGEGQRRASKFVKPHSFTRPSNQSSSTCEENEETRRQERCVTPATSFELSGHDYVKRWMAQCFKVDCHLVCNVLDENMEPCGGLCTFDPVSDSYYTLASHLRAKHHRQWDASWPSLDAVIACGNAAAEARLLAAESDITSDYDCSMQPDVGETSCEADVARACRKADQDLSLYQSSLAARTVCGGPLVSEFIANGIPLRLIHDDPAFSKFCKVLVNLDGTDRRQMLELLRERFDPQRPCLSSSHSSDV